jgi:hypothetical protein
MVENEPPQNLLQKLILLEKIGEGFYEIMADREGDEALKHIYQRLKINELETRLLIEKEMKIKYPNDKIRSREVVVSTIRFFCTILPLSLLKSFLKSILNKRLYSNLSIEHQSQNPRFWDALARHEHLQHELLTPYWKK